MRHHSTELWAALGAMIIIGALYGLVMRQMGAAPAAGGLLGHSLGAIGFVLMLMTETLYSMRKRSRLARWGRTASWLRFHIFTGLLGPFLVLLHSSWQFHGLAGVVTLLTAVIVASGFVGRYIYTAVPRTADGVALGAADLDREIAAAEAELEQRLAGQPEVRGWLAGRLQAATATSGSLRPAFLDWGNRLQWQREWRRLDPAGRTQAREAEQLLLRRRTLERQRTSLALARRLLATWHAVHIPIGMALFTAALVHIVAALYYATLMR